MTQEEKNHLGEINSEAYSCEHQLSGVRYQDTLTKYKEVDDAFYKAIQSLNELMGMITYTIKHNEIDE